MPLNLATAAAWLLLALGFLLPVWATAAHLPLIDLFIRREERQLERDFGDEWRSYARGVRRWL
jgi:protein-S-isoprenylcysteine O-methyltransferase Ste14